MVVVNIWGFRQFASFARKVLFSCENQAYPFGLKAKTNSLYKGRKAHYTLTVLSCAVLSMPLVSQSTPTITPIIEQVQACVVPEDGPLTDRLRAQFAYCLGWRADENRSLCSGAYQTIDFPVLPDDAIRISADETSWYSQGQSKLSGQVQVEQQQRIVTAETAYIYRNNDNKISHVELLDGVRYLEPDKLMIARRAVVNPNDKSGRIEDVLYRFSSNRANAALPAWGRASLIERFANQNLLLRHGSYTTCSPQDKAWHIEAREITFDKSESKAVAKNAVLRIRDWPVLYSPYLSFSTSKERKSGFLMPVVGYTNVGGFDFGLPFYWNMAPNYDATFLPHFYTHRGMMMGGDFRFLTADSSGVASAHVLPNDRAFAQFIDANQQQFPVLRGESNNRWSVLLHEATQFNPNLKMNINFQQVSDDYYLQDFSTNLAVLTQNQLLREGKITYTNEHWALKGMLQSYQTLHPINQSIISDVYERLPSFQAIGTYSDLPGGAHFNANGQFDLYHWPVNNIGKPQGPRYYVNPALSLPIYKPWGYITPEVQLTETYYDLYYDGPLPSRTFNRTIPRYSIDSGLFFERSTSLMGQAFTQTLEPKLFYLYVPFHDQTQIPVFDSGYMIFKHDQLFRQNRFSGFDRIGDANQLAYAVTTRWLSPDTGEEKAQFSIGQIRYFADRQVQLCESASGTCVENPLTLGFLSPVAPSSPIASRASLQLNANWSVSGDYVWDVYNHSTNNGHLNFHYQPADNKIIQFDYSYLTNGDVTKVANLSVQDDALHQSTISYAWPVTERWSTLGAYSYNISKRYSMMSFLGVQYDSCCWAFRLLGGRTFKSLEPNTYLPQYNNNIYLQVLLKGLGSVASTDPSSVIRTYLPGYSDMFKY